MEFFNNNGDSYSGSVVWLTPKYIIDALGGPFDLDPCSHENPPYKIANTIFTKEDNGLFQDWSKYKDVFINPPYDYKSLKVYTDKAIEHKECIMLIYARTDTELFHDKIYPNAHSIFFFKGRLKFLTPSGIESKSPAGAPSCLISFSQNMTDKIEQAYLDEKIKGYLWKL